MATNTIAQSAGFNMSALGIEGLSYDADIVGEAYWGSTPNGTAVSLQKAARSAQNRFASAKVPSVPLLPLVDEDLIYKAIFNIGVGGNDSDRDSYASASEKLRQEFIDKNTLAVDEITKAVTTAEGMIHTIYDEKVAYLYKRPYPIQALFPVVSNKGKVAAWDAIAPYDFGSAYFGGEDATLTESDFQSSQRTETIKYLYSVGRVTRAAQFAGLSAVPTRDLMMIRVDAAQDALRSLRERSILGVTRNVRSKNFVFEPAGSLEYKGLHQLITANVSDPMYEDGTGCTTWDQMKLKLDDSYNKMVVSGVTPNLAICDYKTFSAVRNGLFEYTRTEPIQTFVAGVSKISLVFPGDGGLPLVPHPFLPQTSGSGCIMLAQSGAVERRTLWADMYDDLAKINLSQKFVISAAETLIDKTDISGTASLHGGVFNLN